MAVGVGVEVNREIVGAAVCFMTVGVAVGDGVADGVGVSFGVAMGVGVTFADKTLGFSIAG